MTVDYHQNPEKIDWQDLKQDLIADDFHNGRSTEQLRLSFTNSQLQAYAMSAGRCIGTARALSDGVGNAYVIDVWTHSQHRQQGIASRLMHMLMQGCTGQHVYLQSDDSVEFYSKLGFIEQPVGMSCVIGDYLQNETLNA